jgi:AcrR family transcriptional regulator
VISDEVGDMGIRERQERETLRRKILSAARRSFNESYANVSMRKIAEQIEYSPGHLRYFTSRHLFRAGGRLQVVRAYYRLVALNSALDACAMFWRFSFSKEQPVGFR